METAGSMAVALGRLGEQKATGMLRAGADGAFFLDGGVVTFAEHHSAPGLDELVTASGRVDARDWWRARRAGRPPAPALLDGPELEVFVLLALFDAAYFLLGSTAEPRFEEGVRHWLGPLCRITPATLRAETEHRHAQLAARWPSARADRAPVTPVRRLRRQRLILTGLQAEILLNADGRRTPTELARDLGRTAYGCLLAVRSLVADSLVQAPPPAAPERRAAPPDDPAGGLLDAPTAEPADHPADHPADRSAGEPTGGSLAEPTAGTGAVAAPTEWAPVDQNVLHRLRTALEKLA